MHPVLKDLMGTEAGGQAQQLPPTLPGFAPEVRDMEGQASPTPQNPAASWVPFRDPQGLVEVVPQLQALSRVCGFVSSGKPLAF